MKILVAYYSRTGTTKAVGEYLAKELGADIDEIVDLKERLGPVNYIRAARDAKGLNATEIRCEKNPVDYDVIVIGTPIWRNSLPPAPHTYLSSHSLKGKKVAFFITSASEDREFVFKQMKQRAADSEIIGTCGILQKVVKNGNISDQLAGIIKTLKAESVSNSQVHLVE
ncbi:MAG: flavodoxin [Candidatus Thorarchaeota archaeon]|nr:flavodoxin [Candidatus Thorarchaeota archaeon]